MPSTRDEILGAIGPGDIIYGVAADGQQKLLLVYEANPATMLVRSVTSQSEAEIGRDGRSKWCEWGSSCEIVSVAPLPAAQREVAIALDRRMRTAMDLADLRLSPAEIQLLLTIDDFYRAHPLPER